MIKEGISNNEGGNGHYKRLYDAETAINGMVSGK